MSSKESKKIFRVADVLEYTGLSKGLFYQHCRRKLWPTGVPMGKRAVGWPEYEVEAMLSARIAGLPDTDLRNFVDNLEQRRKALFASESALLGL